MNPEQATIRGFVVRPRQGLYLALLSDRGNRARLTDRLLTGRDFDPAAALPIPEDEQKPKAIEERLRKAGAGDVAHLIAANEKLDNREFALGDALAKVVGKGKPALVSCVAGRLAYFEGLDGERFVLQTAGARKSGRS